MCCWLRLAWLSCALLSLFAAMTTASTTLSATTASSDGGTTPIPAPLVESVSPDYGALGLPLNIVITGQYFVPGETNVTVGGLDCAIQSVTATTIMCETSDQLGADQNWPVIAVVQGTPSEARRTVAFGAKSVPITMIVTTPYSDLMVVDGAARDAFCTAMLLAIQLTDPNQCLITNVTLPASMAGVTQVVWYILESQTAPGGGTAAYVATLQHAVTDGTLAGINQGILFVQIGSNPRQTIEGVPLPSPQPLSTIQNWHVVIAVLFCCWFATVATVFVYRYRESFRKCYHRSITTKPAGVERSSSPPAASSVPVSPRSINVASVSSKHNNNVSRIGPTSVDSKSKR